jgi:pimeloyl-ACP methyl ester carboxylesterase
MAARMSDPSAPNFYKSVPDEQVERLHAFRTRYPYATMDLDGRAWRYIDTRLGDQVLFIFAGGTSIAEISFNTIQHLAEMNRVIAPDYPPIDNLAQLLEGYLAMLDRLGVNRFTIMGGSYGGWMAQSFVRMAPDRVEKVVLSAIGPPNPENNRQLARMLWVLRWIPLPLLRGLMNRTFNNLVSKGDPSPEQALLIAQVEEIMRTRVKRRDILALLRRLIDQTENYRFHPEDLQDWSGRMLVLMGSEDPSTTPEKRAAMAELYPDARQVVFEGADHSLAVTHREAYYMELDTFLAG